MDSENRVTDRRSKLHLTRFYVTVFVSNHINWTLLETKKRNRRKNVISWLHLISWFLVLSRPFSRTIWHLWFRD